MKDRSPTSPALLIICCCLAYHLVGTLAVALRASFPTSLDELAHVSYVRHVAETAELFPDHAAMRTLDPQTLEWSAGEQYLGHPSLYYHLMAMVAPWTRDDPTAVVALLRIANVVISLAAVCLILVTGLQFLRRFPERLLFSVSAVMFPKAAVLGGMVNNDNLAFLAAAFAFRGILQRYESEGKRGSAWIACGVVIAGWSKLTAFLMVGGAIVLAELLAHTFGRRPRWRARHLVIAAAILLGSLPYLLSWAETGHLLYRNDEYFEALAKERGYPNFRFAEYLLVFFRLFGLSWAATEPAAAIQVVGLIVVASVIGIGGRYAVELTRGIPGHDDQRLVAVGLATLAMVGAAIAVLPMHIAFGWFHHRETGHVMGSYSRYYYAVWPGGALAIALAWDALRGKVGICEPKQLHPASLALLVITPVMLLISGIQLQTLVQTISGR